MAVVAPLQPWGTLDLASQRASIVIREQLASIETSVKDIVGLVQ